MFSLMSEEEPISVTHVVELRSDDASERGPHDGARQRSLADSSDEQIDVLGCAGNMVRKHSMRAHPPRQLPGHPKYMKSNSRRSK